MTQISVNDTMAPHPLVTRITRLRGRVRTILALHGTGLAVSVTVGGLFALMLLDYLLHIPAALRLVMLLAGLVGLGVLLWRILLLPLTTRLTDQFLASRVENQNRQLADELMSAVNFIHSHAAATNALAACHIDLAQRNTAGIRFEDAVDFRRPVKTLGIAALIVAIVAIVGFANPSLAGIAFQRWLTAANPKWPHTTNVYFVWNTPDGNAPRVIPMGEKLTVRAMVDKGSRPRVRLTSRTDVTAKDTQLMRFQQEQSTATNFLFESVLEPEGHELTLYLEAGDDNEVSPVTIRMAPRPVITRNQAVIHAPSYVKNLKDPTQPAPAIVINLQNQAARATQGSTIDLNIKASKPFLVNAQGEPEVGLYDLTHDEPLALDMTRQLLTPDSQPATAAFSRNDARLSFTAGKTIQARLFMRDLDGFQNRVGSSASSGAVAIEVVPDAMPTIVITDPRRSVERAPDGIVDVVIQATDDWGFARLRFRADRFDAKPQDPPAFDAPDLPWQEIAADAAVGSTTGKAKYTWNLAPLHLEPGMRLTFYAMVQDNYVEGTNTHDWVSSAPLTLQIRGVADIQEIIRKDLSGLNDRIRSLKGQQEQTRAQTDAMRKLVAGANAISPEQQMQLANLAQQQSQEAATATAIQQRAEQIADDLRQNKMQEGELGKLAQEVNAGMKDVGQQNMPRAGAELSKASQAQNGQPSRGNNTPNQNSQNAQQSSQSMANATQQQDQAIAKMDDLVKKLGAIGDFASLRGETSKLLEQQTKLIKDTQQLAPKTVAQKLESLPKDIRDKIDQLANEQKDLGDKTAELTERMEQASQSLSQSDPASAQSLQKAASASKSGKVSPSQKSASSNISTNKVEEAKNDQQTAQQGLQEMMDELNKNDLRKLEQLAREVRKLIEEVQKLRDDQEVLNKDTIAAGPAAVNAAIQKLANRQGTLQQNAIITQKKAENTQDAGQAAIFIQEGSDHMGDAAGALFSNKPDIKPLTDSLKPQTDAIASLDAALAELKKLRDKVEPELKNKQLSEFIKQYVEIQKDQTAVKTTSDALEVKRLAAIDKELDRDDDMKVGGLAKTQSGLIDRIDALSKDPELGKVEVVVWMNQQVTESMDISKTRLEKLQLGKQTALAQQAAIDRLQLIIDALKEEQQKPPEFNSPPGGGGGGGGGGGKPPLVPPVAQLKLLKAMQIVVNVQTKSVDKDLKAAATDADKNQFQIEAQNLGTKEGRIHDMADKIVQQLLQQDQRPAPTTRNQP